ncbi:MAG: arylsulfatase [Pirellulales bacterium]|nr:arylsulfatase [Pirellulales bacterium]
MYIKTIACAAAAVFAAAGAAAHGAERIPNIVLIYADDLGFGDVSCNGGSIDTLHIDRLAREGLRFTDAHSSAATCTPSRLALLTGQYAFRQRGTGILPGDANLIISPETMTLPKLLEGVAYETGVVGKWHLGLGHGPVDWNGDVKSGLDKIGFGYHFLIAATGDRVPCVYVENDRVVGAEADDRIAVSYGERIDREPSGAERPDLLKQRWSHGHDQSIVNGVSRIGWMTGGERARWVDEDMADVITRKAVEFIDQRAKSNFFLFFSTHDIHVPRVPHARFAGKSGRGPRGDAVLQLDWCVGEIMAALEKHGIADDTLVIFTSDNGPVLDDGYRDQANKLLGDHDPNGPYRAGKYSLYEGGTRVPMMVRWPARVKAGETTDALFGQVDLPASLAKLVVEMPLNAGDCGDSRDELDTLLGEDAVGRPHLVHEAGGHALRMGAWKFIPPGKTRDSLNPGRPKQVVERGELYNLEIDPGEANDLAATEPERLKEMAEVLATIESAPDCGGRETSIRDLVLPIK